MIKRGREQQPIDLPADTRVRQIASSPKSAFAAMISPADLLLARETGFEPIAPVTGTSVYRIGRAGFGASRSAELTILSSAVHGAWKAALVRLQRQARIVGAHGVIGVQAHQKRVEQAVPVERRSIQLSRAFERGDRLEISLTGTAICIPGTPPETMPFITDMAGADVWALRRSGLTPLGFAFGVCVWFQASRQNIANRRNKELIGATKAIYQARNRAIERASQMAHEQGAEGIIGLAVSFSTLDIRYPIEAERSADTTLSFFACGTAVSSHVVGRMPAIDYSLSLSDCPIRGEN